MSITERTEVSDACVEELKKRKVEVISRVWSRILYSTLGEYKEAEIDDPVSGEKKTIGSYDIITKISNQTVEQENYSRFVDGKENFTTELLKRFDDKARSMINEENLRRGIDNIRQDMVTEYSWYKLWTICMKNFCLQYIKALDHPMIIAIDYCVGKW